MQIILYNNSAEKNRVDKTTYLSNALTLNGNLRSNDSGNILSPTIYLEMNNDSVPTYNYCYIPSFNRYYFITSIAPARNDYWEVNMKEDVLMSFKNEIKNQTALVARQENDFNLEIADNLITNFQDKEYYINHIVVDEFNNCDGGYVEQDGTPHIGETPINIVVTTATVQNI